MILETQLRQTMDRLSNGEPVECKEEWIEEAGEAFKETLRKQLFREDEGFRLRMSNIGRPTCQLQREKEGAEKERMPYNHIMRMMIGDAVEVITEILLKCAGANITGGKRKVSYPIADTEINGENDIEIDDLVYDVKSCSPWAYDNKWNNGWEGLAEDDSFGYIGQLIGYCCGSVDNMGGWIVVNKSTGEVTVVEANPSAEEVAKREVEISDRIIAVENDAPFKPCFTPYEEKFRSTPTGSLRLPTQCGFCSFRKACYPEAVYKPQTGSQAKSPRHYWYALYNESYA